MQFAMWNLQGVPRIMVAGQKMTGPNRIESTSSTWARTGNTSLVCASGPEQNREVELILGTHGPEQDKELPRGLARMLEDMLESDRMSKDMVRKIQQKMSKDTPATTTRGWMSEHAPIRMSEDMPDRMLERMSGDVTVRMPKAWPDRKSERMF